MRAGRLARRALKYLLLGTVGLVLGLLLLVQFALALPAVREVVREQAVGLGSEALEAELAIDHIDAISVFGHLQARGVRLRNAQGVEVASVQRVAARFDPLALVYGTLRFASLRVTQPWVDLGAPAEPGDRRGLLGVFVKDEPEPETDGSGLDVVLDGIEIEDGKLLAEVEGELWSAASLDLEGEIEIGDEDEIALELEHLYTELARGGKPAATLKKVEGEYGADGAIELHAEIVQDGARVVADAELGSAGDDGARELAAHLQAQGVDARTLAGFGLRFDELTAPVGLELRARGTTQALAAELQLRTAGGDLDVRGDYDQKRGASARLHTERLEPARFLRTQIAPVALELQVTARPDPELPAAAVDAVIESGSYDAMALPRTTLKARVNPEQGVWVDELVAQYEHGRLSAHGQLQKSGALSGEVQLRSAALSELPPVRAFAPTLAGVLDATLKAERGASGPIRLQAAVDLRQAAFEDVRAHALEVEGQVIAESSDDARVKLQVGASSLQVGDEHVAYAEAELHGGPEHYEARVSLGERGRLKAQIERTGPEAISTRGEGRFVLGDKRTVEARWDEIGYAAGEVRLRAVHVDYYGAKLQVDGTFDPDGRSALRAHLQSGNLLAATSTFMERPIPGAIALDVTLEGETERPRVSVEGRYRDGALLGLEHLAVDLDADADLRARTFAVKADARASGGSVTLDLKSDLGRGKPSLALLERGHHELELQVEDVPLHELDPWPTEPTVPERARVSGGLRVSGELERFVASFDLRSRLRFRGDRAPVFARVQGEYTDAELALKLDARDSKGPLIRSSIHTELERRRFGTLPDHPLDILKQRAWQASLWLGSRRVQELPAVRALEVHPALLPAQVAAEIEIKHEPSHEPQAELSLTAVWDPPGEHTEEPRCGLSRAMKIDLGAEMKDGRLETLVRGHLADQQVLEIKTASQAPIDEWFAPGPPSQVRPVSMVAKLASVQLRDIPVVCESAFGFISADIDVERAGSEQVKAKVDLIARDVHLGQAPAFHGKLSASADRNALAVWADIRGNYTGHAVVRGRVPIDGGGHAPTLDLDAPASLQIALDKLDARTLLAAVPNVRATRGKLDGRIALDSPLRTPRVKGSLEVRDVAVTLPTLGQRFERVNGELLLTGNTVHIEGLELRDREGKAKLSGEFTVRDLTTFETKLRADASNFPVRRSGVMLARLDGRVGLNAKVQPKRTEVEVSLRNARVELTGESLDGVQSLQENPQIVFVDELGQEIEQEEEEEEVADAVTIIRIDADDPFWIRRADFSVLVRAKLLLEMRSEQPSVSGEVEIERGVVELVGQMFDIERGRIEFMGGHEQKPRLDLVAVRKVPGGATVKVQAQGEVDEPQLTFLVDGDPVTAGEALQAATGTGVSKGGDESAQQQVGSFATGIATSVLTLGARNEIGEWMPVLAVEGEGSGARLRAGVEAGRLIPPFLRKVVVDAYLEGSLSSAPEAEDSQSTSNSNTGPAAVLLELRYPHDLVSEAQYGPGQQWSVDLLWEP